MKVGKAEFAELTSRSQGIEEARYGSFDGRKPVIRDFNLRFTKRPREIRRGGFTRIQQSHVIQSSAPASHRKASSLSPPRLPLTAALNQTPAYRLNTTAAAALPQTQAVSRQRNQSTQHARYASENKDTLASYLSEKQTLAQDSSIKLSPGLAKLSLQHIRKEADSVLTFHHVTKPP